MKMPQKIYTISSGSSAGHITSVHLDLESLCTEVNSHEENYLDLIREVWGKDADFEVDFAEFIKEHPSEVGWGWDSHPKDGDWCYLNISVHTWSNTYFETQG